MKVTTGHMMIWIWTHTITNLDKNICQFTQIWPDDYDDDPRWPGLDRQSASDDAESGFSSGPVA